jgi:hypothetical protein
VANVQIAASNWEVLGEKCNQAIKNLTFYMNFAPAVAPHAGGSSSR